MKNQKCKLCGKTDWLHKGDEFPDKYGYIIIEHYECKVCGNKATKEIKVTFNQQGGK